MYQEQCGHCNKPGRLIGRSAPSVTPTFILHLGPDSFEPDSTGGYDHLPLVVEETGTETLAEYLRTSGVEVERRLEGVVGAQGEGGALYAREPDGLTDAERTEVDSIVTRPG